MIYANCRECEHLDECYPKGTYIEVQLDAEIKRDLCMNNEKVDWKQKES